MDFDFSSGDYDAFDQARQSFLDDLAQWAAQQSRQGLVQYHVSTFLNWNFENRQQSLRTLSQADIEEYLLRSLPRTHLGDAEDAADICKSLELMIEFLAVNDLLDNPFERAASLITFISDVSDNVAAAIGDKGVNFGTSTSLLSAPLTDDDGLPLPNLDELLDREDLDIDELQKLLDQRFTAFNALPFEERERITDTPELQGEPIPLPFTYVPPHEAEVEATASFADVVKMADRFVEIAHDKGIALTGAGNIKLADAQSLAVELETGDRTEGVTSSLEMRWVTLIDDLTTAVGAVDRMKTKIKADRSWFDRTATGKATAMCDLILDSGFLSSAEVSPEWLHALRQLIDDGVPHWLSPGLVEGNGIAVDDVMELAVEVAAIDPSSRRKRIGEEVFDDWVVAMIAELFSGLERFGLLVWDGAESQPSFLGERETLMGGEVTLTPLGRHVLPEHVRAAGYSFDTIAGLEEATAEQMVDIALAGGLTGSELLERWQPDEPLADRAEALASHVMTGDHADRLIAFDFFETVEQPDVVGPIVRQLLDSPAGAYAATYLLEHGLATAAEVGGFIDLTPLVDMLTMAIGDPEVFDELFREAADTIDGDLLEDLWRHDQPETAGVLEAAGLHVADKALAKKARSAANKHRSWLANQGR